MRGDRINSSRELRLSVHLYYFALNVIKALVKSQAIPFMISSIFPSSKDRMQNACRSNGGNRTSSETPDHRLQAREDKTRKLLNLLHALTEDG